MRNRTKRLVESIRESANFARGEPKFRRVPALAKLADQLQVRSAAAWDLWVAEQGAAKSRGRGAHIQRVKDQLRNSHLRLLARAGKQVMGSAPGAERAFRSPAARATGDKVVAASRAMLKVVGKRQRLFAELLDEEFFIRMKALTDTLAAEWQARDMGRKEWTSTLKRLEVETRKGRQLIELITVMLIAHFPRDHELLGTWKLASRVGRRRGRPLKRTRTTATQSSRTTAGA